MGRRRSSSFRTDRRRTAPESVSTLRFVTTAAAIAVTDRVLTSDPDAACPTVDSGGLRPSAAGDLAEVGTEAPTTRDSYPTVVWLLLGGNLLVRSAGFAYPFLAYHVAGRGHAPAAIGVVLAAYGLGWAVGQLLCGWLVDRIGARTTLVSTMSVAAAALVLMAGAPSLAALLVGATIAGLVCDSSRPVLGAAIADLFPSPRDGRESMPGVTGGC